MSFFFRAAAACVRAANPIAKGYSGEQQAERLAAECFAEKLNCNFMPFGSQELAA